MSTGGIFYGDGSGNFQVDTTAPITFAYALVDANQDQFLDVVTSTTGSAVQPMGLGVRLNDGNAVFNLTQEVTIAIQGPSTPGDFNEDGLIDLAQPGGDYIRIVQGDGTGFIDTQRLPLALTPGEVEIADLDGDNLLDILATQTSTLKITTALAIPGLADGSLGTPSIVDFQGKALDLTDLNGDGLLDLVSELMVALNTGSGNFAAPTTLGVGNQPVDVTVVRGDDDSFLDLIVGAFASDNAIFMSGDGSQSFITTSTFNEFRVNQVEGAFLDADDLEDFAVGDFNGLHIYLNSPSGYSPGQSFALGGNLVKGIGSGDFNRDGFTDLIATTQTSGRQGFYTVFLNDGTGGFTQGLSIELTTEAGEIDVADLDLDGFLDVVIAGELDNSVTILYGGPNGSFQRDLDLVSGSRVTPFGLSIGDVNGDLKPDIVTANGNEASVGVFLQR